MPQEKRRRLCTGRRLTALFLLMLALAVLSLLLGSTTLSLPELIRAVRTGDRESVSWRIFFYTRLPRVLGGLLCGSGLAVAGAVLQVVRNNALAGPNIIGVNAGAGFGALLVMALFPRWAAALPVAAFLGALACAAVIYGVARLTGSLGCVLFCIQAFTVVPIYTALSLNRKNAPVWPGMLVYYLLYFNSTLNMMRQWMAMGIIALALVLLNL